MLGTFPVARADDAVSKDRAAATETSWHSPSLAMETVTGPNGVITTRVALGANALWGITDKKVVETVIPGVYALRGWGIASSFAIEAPGGWIVVDTGDSTRAAGEMREMLERTLGRKIKVAAILLTHWHYADPNSADVTWRPGCRAARLSRDLDRSGNDCCKERLLPLRQPLRRCWRFEWRTSSSGWCPDGAQATSCGHSRLPLACEHAP